jgi:hypothetical protein
MITNGRHLPNFTLPVHSFFSDVFSFAPNSLERPCFDHIQFLMVRSQDSEGDISGHTLMATCPPESHIIAHPEEPYPHKMPDIGMQDLVKLLDLSNRLPLDGEITPIMAWAGIFSHPRVQELDQKDFESIRSDLLPKIRCYGYARPCTFLMIFSSCCTTGL